MNKRLEGAPSQSADTETRGLIERWGKLHGVRSALGAAATFAYLCALLWPGVLYEGP